MSSGHWLLLHLLLGFVFGFGTFPLREPTAVSVVQPAIRTCAAQCLMTYSCVGRGTSAPILPNGFSLTDPRARRARAVPKFFFLKAFLFRFLLSLCGFSSVADLSECTVRFPVAKGQWPVVGQWQ